MRQPPVMSVVRTELEDPRLRLLVCGYTRILAEPLEFLARLPALLALLLEHLRRGQHPL